MAGWREQLHRRDPAGRFAHVAGHGRIDASDTHAMVDDADWVDGWADQIEAAHPGVNLHVHRDIAGNIVVSTIRVPAPQRRQGTGGEIMRALLAAADAAGDQVALTPAADFAGPGTPSKAQLTRWYRSLGFVPNKGRRKDFSTRETMIRPPQQRR